MKAFVNSATLIFCLSLGSCASLKPPQITRNEAMENYKYFYISPINSVSSNIGLGFSDQYFASNRTVSPTEIITGMLTKEGFIRLPELKPELSDLTSIVNYGESSRRNTGLSGYTIEVTIQFISAKSHTEICTCTAEGQGETEADDIRIAINRCLSALFTNDSAGQGKALD